jgi:hypothetical protein
MPDRRQSGRSDFDHDAAPREVRGECQAGGPAGQRSQPRDALGRKPYPEFIE